MYHRFYLIKHFKIYIMGKITWILVLIYLTCMYIVCGALRSRRFKKLCFFWKGKPLRVVEIILYRRMDRITCQKYSVRTNSFILNISNIKM